jgi:hypothetical protein
VDPGVWCAGVAAYVVKSRLASDLVVAIHAAREWAYDRKSHIGQLDKGLGEAQTRGWTMVCMKDDWKRILAFCKHE